ncbi:hypothetical protein, partial [Serratia sp. 506_PEND]|uniref:hypothetical protein n=1 Tax=Serratia sp. 506_PEND TaxID=1572666 RepID=UPI000AD3E980
CCGWRSPWRPAVANNNNTNNNNNNEGGGMRQAKGPSRRVMWWGLLFCALSWGSALVLMLALVRPD